MQVDARIERSVERMMTVIDCGRNIRERHNRPLKTPLRSDRYPRTRTLAPGDVSNRAHSLCRALPSVLLCVE